MKQKNWWKITLLILAILTCISIPIILYFTIGQKDTSGKVDLNNQTVNYSSIVQHMNNITEQEATTIKNDIPTNVNDKLTKLGLTIDTDYTINNLDTIKASADLSNIIITITSTDTSTKATGGFNLTLTITENISDRSISPISIPASEADGLSQDTVDTVLLTIQINTEDVLSKGQDNQLNRDFKINNQEMITVGAVFTNYQNQISIVALPTSTHLTGTFKITFQLE